MLYAQFLAACAIVRGELEAIHWLAPWVVLSVATWLFVYAIRRWLPSLWEPLTRWPSGDTPASHVLQALPSAIIGAAWASATTDESAGMAVYGAVAGLAAPLIHHVLRALPGPYRGALRLGGSDV